MQLTVKLTSCEYPIYISNGCLQDHALLRKHIRSKQILVITNEVVGGHYLEWIQQAFHDFQCDVLMIKDGEQYKNQDSLSRIYDALLKYGHTRETTLVALGGGVIGDITGFAAATYQRGVAWIQIPTTLLSQVDAAIGGKTAINHPLGKNMIGCFYQPHAVIADPTTLQTLPEREFVAGFAEIIKYGLLKGGKLLKIIETLCEDNLQFSNQPVWIDLIAECCAVKIEYVQIDEKDRGVRALLNLGHTFGHALEAYTDYQDWLHGEAVAIGLYYAALLSFHLGYLTTLEVNYLDNLLKRAKLPNRIPKGMDIKKLIRAMMHDKKNKDHRICFVVIKKFGHCELEHQVSNEVLQAVLSVEHD